MGNHYEWTTAASALYVLTTREQAPEALRTAEEGEGAVTASLALFIGSGDGDGVIIEGERDELLEFADLVHRHVHRGLVHQLADYEARILLEQMQIAQRAMGEDGSNDAEHEALWSLVESVASLLRQNGIDVPEQESD